MLLMHKHFLLQLVQSLVTVNSGPGSAIPESCALIPCCHAAKWRAGELSV